MARSPKPESIEGIRGQWVQVDSCGGYRLMQSAELHGNGPMIVLDSRGNIVMETRGPVQVDSKPGRAGSLRRRRGRGASPEAEELAGELVSYLMMEDLVDAGALSGVDGCVGRWAEELADGGGPRVARALSQIEPRDPGNETARRRLILRLNTLEGRWPGRSGRR